MGKNARVNTLDGPAGLHTSEPLEKNTKRSDAVSCVVPKNQINKKRLFVTWNKILETILPQDQSNT